MMAIITLLWAYKYTYIRERKKEKRKKERKKEITINTSGKHPFC